MNKLSICEIFGPTISGEGALIGQPTVFVRTGGCDYRCSWCDSLYAVLPEYKGEWRRMSTGQIFDAIRDHSPYPILVTVSGGNPAVQDLGELIDMLHVHGYSVCMETQGSIARSYMARLDYLTISPKPPSSHMILSYDKLHRCMMLPTKIILKVVVFTDADYAFAKDIHRRYPSVPMYLQTGNEKVTGEFDVQAVLDKTRWLADTVLADQWNDVIVLPQYHTLLWGNNRRV